MARFFNSWADIVLIPGIASFVAADILRHLDPRDRDYFRQTREKRFGISMDDFAPAAKRASQVSGKAWSLCVRRSKRNRSSAARRPFTPTTLCSAAFNGPEQ
jgi:hypothetical protein